MATIKSFTSLEQSKVLAEILPLESADMMYEYLSDSENYLDKPTVIPIKDYLFADDLPCWSLTSLLSVLPNEVSTADRFECKYQIHIRKYDGGDNTTFYQIAYGNNRGLSGSWHDMINTGEKENLIDCCVQMIIKLHELNLL